MTDPRHLALEGNDMLATILLAIAAVCFALAAFGHGRFDRSSSISLTPLGLLLVVLAKLVG